MGALSEREVLIKDPINIGLFLFNFSFKFFLGGDIPVAGLRMSFPDKPKGRKIFIDFLLRG